MSKVAPWLDDKPVLDVTTATTLELLDTWAANRNSTLGAMAAEEVTRRLFKQREKETKK